MSMIALALTVLVQASDPYVAPPTIRKPSACTCKGRGKVDVVIKGFVVDAEVILGADRRSVEDRMATIFDVEYASAGDFKGRTRIWHYVSTENCGVTFDYGKKYTVLARYGDDEDLETDACLMGQ